MPDIIPPNPLQPITDEQGGMDQVFMRWTHDITRLDLIVGSGSPEGVVSAEQGRQYMDEDGAVGFVDYRKQKAAIANDPTTGWVLIG